MKKVWRFLFPLLVCLILPLPHVFAAPGDVHSENGFSATEREDGFLRITSYEPPLELDEDGKQKLPAKLEIPATIDGLEVKEISRLFKNSGDSANCRTSVKEVILPEGLQTLSYVTSSGVRRGVFQNCALTSVYIPSTLETAYYTFSGCESLENVRFGTSLPRVPATLFSGCTGLKEISLPPMTTVVEESAFQDCTNLKTVTFPSNNYLTEIQAYAFQNTALESLTLPTGLRTIGASAFANCSALKTLDMPATLRTVGASAFANSVLETVDMSTGLQTLGDSAFANCTELKSVLVSPSLTAAGSADYPVFAGCSSLNDVRFYDGVTSIVANLFARCSGLKRIIPEPSAVSVGSGDSMGDGLQMPNTVVSIKSGAFAYSGLTSIEIPDSVTSYGARAFRNCAGLREATLSLTAPAISSQMFYKCYFLESLNIGKQPDTDTTVTSIGKEAFYECKRLTKLPEWQSLTSIGDFAFYRCEALPSISLPQYLTSIGVSAFQNDFTLNRVVIPGMITEIPEYAFAQCSALTDIAIPKTVTTIANHAFFQDTALLRVFIPASVTSISDDEAFSYVDRMTIEVAGSYAEDWARRNGAREVVDKSVPIEVGKIHLAGGADSMILPRNGVIAPVFDTEPAENTDVLTLTSSNSAVAVRNGYILYCTRNITEPVTITATATSGLVYEFTVTCEDMVGLELPAPEIFNYVVGDSLDLSGLTPEAVFQSGARQPLYNYPPNADTIRDNVLAWTASELESDSAGSKNVTVSYNNFSATFPVEVFDEGAELPVSLRRVERTEDSVRVWTNGVAGAKFCAVASFDAEGACLGVEFKTLSGADTTAGFADFSALPETASVTAMLLDDDALTPSCYARTLDIPQSDEAAEDESGEATE